MVMLVLSSVRSITCDYIMKSTTTTWTCDRCRKEFDDEQLIQSTTANVYRRRGVATFSRKYKWSDMAGDHISDDSSDLCASCAEIVEKVITG